MKNILLLITISIFVSSCSIPNMVVIELESKSSSQTNGFVVFIEEDSKVTMEATINNLEPGEHAIHIHEKSDCSSVDGKSAGGHWNPTLESHGKWGDSKGFHRGDIGNFNVDENGNGTVSFSTDLWCLDCDDLNKNIIGKSIIIHQGSVLKHRLENFLQTHEKILIKKLERHFPQQFLFQSHLNIEQNKDHY